MSDKIHWDDTGQPVSIRYGDVYFSKDDGLAESRYVFLDHSQLSQRFQQLTAHSQFTIGETGFGTGLNFLACWQLWLLQAPETAHLTFVSVEKYPLTHANLSKSLSLWPQLSALSEQLLNQWKIIYTGSQRNTWLTFHFDRVRLIVIIDDAASGFQQLLGSNHPEFFSPKWHRVDAWLLDGFAPAKNPDMWQQSLFDTIGLLSGPHTTFATFTAAGKVKRGLTEAGFAVYKTTGFGRKRDMLYGSWQHKPTSTTLKKDNSDTPWYLINDYQPTPPSTTVAVIGAGLAGCHTARALANRGFEVVLIDRHSVVAQEASGNLQGVVYAKLSSSSQGTNDYGLAGLLYSLPLYHQFWQQADANQGSQCGVLQLSYNDKLRQTHQQLAQQFGNSRLLRYLSPAAASNIAGSSLSYPALFFADSGWLNPPALCRWLVDHPNIQWLRDTAIDTLTQTDSGWSLEGEQQGRTWQQLFTTVVIATAKDASYFSQTQQLPLKAIRGQVSYLDTPSKWQRLQTVVCAEGYIAPSTTINSQAVTTLGASFNIGDSSIELHDKDHQENIGRITQYLPLSEPLSNVDGRVSFRAATPDYLPLVGPVPISQAFETSYLPLARNAQKAIAQPGTYLPGLFINAGHGSKGLISTPLAAAIITSYISGDLPPLPQALVNRINPARFLIRDIIRRQ